MQARWVAYRRLDIRVPPVAHAHPPCGARHAVDGVRNPTAAERSGIPTAAASTRGAGDALNPLADSIAADAVAAAPATVKASATPSRRRPSRLICVWLPLALLLACDSVDPIYSVLSGCTTVSAVFTSVGATHTIPIGGSGGYLEFVGGMQRRRRCDDPHEQLWARRRDAPTCDAFKPMPPSPPAPLAAAGRSFRVAASFAWEAFLACVLYLEAGPRRKHATSQRLRLSSTTSSGRWKAMRYDLCISPPSPPSPSPKNAQVVEQWSSDGRFAVPEPYLPHRSYDPPLPPPPSFFVRQLRLVTAQMLATARETAAAETHRAWLLPMHARSGRAAKPPRPIAAGEHPMWTAEKPPTITLPPEDAHDGLALASLLSALIALIVIRMRRRCAVRKRRAQAVPLSRKTSANARTPMLSRYSVAVLLLANPGAHAELEAGWHQCCTEGSIRGGDMVHGAMNGDCSSDFSQDQAKELCQSTPNCSFVSYWGASSNTFTCPSKPNQGVKLSTSHASADAGVKTVTSGSSPATALIVSRCRPELQPMRVRRRGAAAH
jgi:hypothetical protein